MALDFCTRLTRKVAKAGYEKKVARRIARFCYLSMTLVCGLFGLFERVKAPIHLTACSGMYAAGARAGRLSPAFSVIRR